MKKRSLALLLALIIGIGYFGFCSRHFFGATVESAESGEAAAFIGTALASALVAPHIALGWIAAVLNLAAFLGNSRGCAMAAFILYSISAVLFFMYAPFVVPEIILSIIGYVRLKKINEKNALREQEKAAHRQGASA